MTETEIDRAAEIAALGLTADAVFVPFSRSRNKAEKSPSLNWRVTIKRNGREVLTCDYSEGVAHCPSYGTKPPAPWPQPVANWVPLATKAECETGFATKRFGFAWGNDALLDRSKPILPNPLDVLYSINMDADALNYATFEDWAATMGYDPDSRAGEAIYRACLEHGLKLRAHLGEAGLERLNVIFQDY
jgi:hypothetical protein